MIFIWDPIENLIKSREKDIEVLISVHCALCSHSGGVGVHNLPEITNEASWPSSGTRWNSSKSIMMMRLHTEYWPTLSGNNWSELEVFPK